MRGEIRPRRDGGARTRSTLSNRLSLRMASRRCETAIRIQSGERISGFIRRLTRADLVVAVISDKYLRSPYCMYEIYRLWQRSQGDPDELARRLVPVVPCRRVRIGSTQAGAARFTLSSGTPRRPRKRSADSQAQSPT